MIGYGDGDAITIQHQFNGNCGIERVELSNGSFLTHWEINKIIRDMTAFASRTGIQLCSIDDVAKNQTLMAMIVQAWHT